MNNITSLNTEIEKQKERSFNAPPALNIIDACKKNKGILILSDELKKNYVNQYVNSTAQTTFFIPASGSGSRMFEFLFNFITQPNDDNQGKVERFINHFDEFAFSKKVNREMMISLRNGTISLDDFISYLLNEHGLNFGNLPKGLIPFHRIGPFILTPFQSHIVQGLEIASGCPKFHFTVNGHFQTAIHTEQTNIERLIAQNIHLEYSVQVPETDAFVFDENQALVLTEESQPLKRPAGHGALLENLNKLDGDVIFVKNIDNIQHFNKSYASKKTFQFLGGLVLALEKERNELLSDFSRGSFILFNDKYEILLPEEVVNLTDEQIINALNLPIRVCGMVKNEGEPGGGPFWLNKDGITRKQIIEKAQINTRDKSYSLLINSTHFNPVIMALCNKDKNGKPFDLTQLTDENQYFNVRKPMNGNSVYFTEKPGLWNGSMYNWLTVFVEIPSETFSPVKTILDLLGAVHKEK